MAIVKIKGLQFLEHVADGNIRKWNKKIGDEIEQDEILVEIETDKITIEVPSPVAGILIEITKSDGAKVAAGEIIAKINTVSKSVPFDGVPVPKQLFGTIPEPDGLDLGILNDDRVAVHDSKQEQRDRRVPMSRLRSSIAARLLQSQSSNATTTTFNEVNMQPLISLRNSIKQQFNVDHGVSLGFTAFFVKAVIAALQRYPILNASVDGADIVYHDYFDIGIAVTSPRGLVVPVLRSADQMSIAEIERKVHEFALKAKNGTLTVDELTGGTFTVTNSGIFGSMLSVPIINPPQSAILGVHATTVRPVCENDKIVSRPITYLALSYDHRIVDGREAVLGLVAMKESLENPVQWLTPERRALYRADLMPDRSRPTNPRENTSVPVPCNRDALHEKLVASLAALLRIPPDDISLDSEFVDLGLDSIGAVDWADEISRHYDSTVAPTMIYAYSTIRRIAHYLSSRLDHTSTRRSNHAATSEEQQHGPSMAPQAVVVAPRPASNENSIAIIGMSAKYAGAGTLDQYWDNLCKGINSIVEIPKSRWDVAEYFDSRPFQFGKTYSKWLGLIEDVDFFDSVFFNISPADAELMDPQHRVFLQEAYRAFEDAGYAPHDLNAKNCGVYLGLCNNDYGLLQRGGEGKTADRLGNSCALASARIAYHLNLKGPALTIDTACSSSLVAIHLASKALLNGETELALAGGVSFHLAPELYVCWSAAGMLADDGLCKTFDNRANGFVAGDGCGALVLKRLVEAERDGDNIYGVLIGSGLNQDGKTNGITAPSMTRQTELIREIYQRNNIDASSISYVEAHGTGTKLGDPIELEALSTAFRADTTKTGFCALGSVKTNIGHTVAAAGVAGVQKVLLALKNKQLVPSINFNKPNEHFDFDASPFYVNTQLQPWISPHNVSRRAAVSSFGVSGTNAHLVLEEYVASTVDKSTSHRAALFVMSAKSSERLKAYAESMVVFLESHREIDIQDAAYTFQVGREPMDCRFACVVDSCEDLLARMKIFLHGNSYSQILLGNVVSRNGGTTLASAVADEMATRWIDDREYEKLGRAWVIGFHVDWRRLHEGERRQRISLPTYPFLLERHWLTNGTDQLNSFQDLDAQRLGNCLNTKREISAHPMAMPHFNAEFYDLLIDDVMNDVLTVDEAAAAARVL